VAADNETTGSIPDRTGLVAFLIGLIAFTAFGFVAAPGFVDGFCGALVDRDDALQSIADLAKDVDGTGPVRDNAVWALNQVGMCIDANVLADASPVYPSTFALAFASMMLGLFGGLTALAARMWPSARRAAPHLFNEAVAGGSLGLAFLALASMLDWTYVGWAVFALVGFCVLMMLILQHSPRWLAAVLVFLLVLALLGVVLAIGSSSPPAAEDLWSWWLVLALLAAAFIVLAKVVAEIRGALGRT
jgi:hypothetical protein